MSDSSDRDARGRPASVSIEPRADRMRVSESLATQMLPLVSRIVTDLREEWRAWRAAVSRYDAVLATLDVDPESPLARVAEKDVRTRAAAVEALRDELRPLGATCPSPRTGRVEWVSMHDGVLERLVWHPGDERVIAQLEQGEMVSVPDEDDPSRS
jgi:hypothetical protein